MASSLVQQPFLSASGVIFIPVVVVQHSVTALSLSKIILKEVQYIIIVRASHTLLDRVVQMRWINMAVGKCVNVVTVRYI